MVEQARSRGHVAHIGKLDQLIAQGKRFDLVAAFDVIEHLSWPDINEFFLKVAELLNAGGKILLQFPNSASPLSTFYQGGDATHQVSLSKESIDQLARPRGWVVCQHFNARVSSTKVLKNIKWWLRHAMRDFIECIVCLIYYGSRQPLDPNIVVVLERASQDEKSATAVVGGRPPAHP